MANRWLTCPTLWIWIWVMCWTQSLAPQKGEKRSPESERETAGDRFSFLLTEAVKVSQKPIIKCIMCHFLVSQILRDWKADLELCGLTTLSWSSSVLFEDKPRYVAMWGNCFQHFTLKEASEISVPLHDMLLHLWIIQIILRSPTR